ncbi:hypothetical protein Sm713_74460 [Streptomyces sp. TS71-3]|nr:hypothetical protein Sm713_74460 [Streptomyces sp. TS71-3]
MSPERSVSASGPGSSGFSLKGGFHFLVRRFRAPGIVRVGVCQGRWHTGTTRLTWRGAPSDGRTDGGALPGDRAARGGADHTTGVLTCWSEACMEHSHYW